MTAHEPTPRIVGQPGAECSAPLRADNDAPQPIQYTQRHWILQALTAAYRGNTYQLLRDLADTLQASVAYVDRATVEAHLDRVLSENQWAAVNDQFAAMDFDDHIGEQGRLRTDWIESLLARADVPGYGGIRGDRPTEDPTAERASGRSVSARTVQRLIDGTECADRCGTGSPTGCRRTHPPLGGADVHPARVRPSDAAHPHQAGHS
jgi:hypothetical protein